MAGRVVGGRAFTRTSLYQLLTNPLYAGRVRHKAEVFPGEHPALIDPKMFDRVQERLRHNGRQGAGPGQSKTKNTVQTNLLTQQPRFGQVRAPERGHGARK